MKTGPKQVTMGCGVIVKFDGRVVTARDPRTHSWHYTSHPYTRVRWRQFGRQLLRKLSQATALVLALDHTKRRRDWYGFRTPWYPKTYVGGTVCGNTVKQVRRVARMLGAMPKKEVVPYTIKNRLRGAK